jgi:hypothetical protein
MTTRLHDWVDYYHGNEAFDPIRELLGDAVRFCCGPIDDLPKLQVSKFDILRPPFPVTVLEFEHADDKPLICTIVFIKDIGDDNGFLFISGQKIRATGEWRTIKPCIGRKNELGGFSFEGYTDQQDYAGIWFCWSAHIFQLLNCTNIVSIEHVAPIKLNKKRIAQGKCPVFSFKTLRVKVPNEGREKKPSLGGTHSNPRVHLRRGHIRRLPTGKSTWVQSCVVGSLEKGAVHKDYSIVV